MKNPSLEQYDILLCLLFSHLLANLCCGYLLALTQAVNSKKISRTYVSWGIKYSILKYL